MKGLPFRESGTKRVTAPLVHWSSDSSSLVHWLASAHLKEVEIKVLIYEITVPRESGSVVLYRAVKSVSLIAVVFINFCLYVSSDAAITHYSIAMRLLNGSRLQISPAWVVLVITLLM